MPKKHVTFDDIARYTHFSKTTISRFFNNPSSLTPRNQEIIRQALVDLNYQENKVAQILAKGHTEYIGIILPNLYLHYFAEILNQILLTYEEFGYKFLVFVGNSNPEVEQQYIRELISYQIEGLLVLSHTIPSSELAALHIPVVSVEREDQFISSVNCDNYQGARAAVQLLHQHGCEVFIHINTPTPENIPSYQRITGFEDYCAEHNLPHAVFIREVEASAPKANIAMQALLEQIETAYPDQKKGIFFSDDTRANIFLNLLVRKYRSLPDNYQLIGFDNSPISQQAVYSISTVGQQINQIAHEAVSLLISLIDERRQGSGSDAPPVHKVITPVLFERETTR